MRTALRAVVLVFVVLVAIPLAWEFVPFEYACWTGSFDLTINVTSTAGALRSVRCKACWYREEAEWVMQDPLHPEARANSVLADPFDGKPLTLRVTLTGRDSPWGRELSRHQHGHFLVVIGHFQDGRQVMKLIEIPDCRKSREVSVSLP